MHQQDELLAVPAACVQWCASQPHDVTVLDDMVAVELDWWNLRLECHDIPVRIVGHDSDGQQVDAGRGHISRGDLQTGDTRTQAEKLTKLYHCAAWLTAHPLRGRARRFVDVRDRVASRHRFGLIDEALNACERGTALIDGTAVREWSGWPKAPGVGPGLLSLYCWSVHDGASPRPQLLDQQSVASLVYEGWLQNPSVPQFTVTRYKRYTDLIHRWSEQAQTSAELVELWLNHAWRDRIAAESRSQ